MASVARDRKGRRVVQFKGLSGRRETISLGRVTQRQAERVRDLIEDLRLARRSNTAPPPATAEWLGDLPAEMHERLARVGLVPPRECRECPTLGEWLDGYIDGRTDAKPNTRTVWGHTRRNLVAFFGKDKPIDAITPGDADEWRLYLIGEKLADNTVRRRCGIAKQFFNFAKRKRVLAENPFADLKAVVQANRKRDYNVTLADTQKVLDACPDAEWRALFALARYGGLRCPSEILGLKLQDIDWAGGRFTVHSPKTEHHQGGESRQVPLFPELVPYLREVFEQAEPGAEYVITRYRRSNQNLSTQLRRIIKRAGLTPWPKLYQNLRATRETELAERWPEHVVCAWIGHSSAVARKHYLQVTDEHFRAALQPALQQVRTPGHIGPQVKGQDTPEPASSQSVEPTAMYCNDSDMSMVGATGHEHKAESPEKQALSDSRAATGAASSADSDPGAPNPAAPALPPDVAELARRLAALPEAVRAEIVAMVKAAQRSA